MITENLHAMVGGEFVTTRPIGMTDVAMVPDSTARFLVHPEALGRLPPLWPARF
jgi:hypothetical protein